jgi:tRNA A37 threonylcarbamoyladenosine synthetase subunit TsaC/SUA5/YrdC
MVAVAASRGSHAAPTTATQGSEIWGSDVPLWLNSGAAHSDLQSTVIDVRSDRPNIVRLGSLTASTLRGVVPGITMIAN